MSAKTARSIDFPIEPLFNNVLIEPINEFEEKQSGLYVVEPKEGEKPLIGIVRAIPTRSWTEDKKIIQPSVIVRIGEKVIYRKWSMSEVKHNGKPLIIVGQKDIAAVLSN